MTSMPLPLFAQIQIGNGSAAAIWGGVVLSLAGTFGNYLKQRYDNTALKKQNADQAIQIVALETKASHNETAIKVMAAESKVYKDANDNCKKKCSGFAVVVALYRRIFGRHPDDTIQLFDPSDMHVEPIRPAVGATIKPSAGTVLVVEDDRTSRKALAGILRSAGFIPSEASSLADALAAVEDRPDFILLDLMLPDGDGLDVLRRVRAMELPSRVVVCSGTSEPDRIGAIKSLAPFAMLPKPITGAEAIFAAMGVEVPAKV